MSDVQNYRSRLCTILKGHTEYDFRLTRLLLWQCMNEMDAEELTSLVQFAQEWRAHSPKAQAEYFEFRKGMPVIDE